MLAEMDSNVGSVLDAVDRLGIADDTLVIFTSDNGPEFFKPWDGWAGPWRGQYFTALEGGIRVPFMVRWPGKIAPGRVSNEIVHGVDMFATLASLAGAKVPAIDRSTVSTSPPSSWETRRSRPREGFPIWGADILLAVKWRNWKLHFYRQDSMFDPPAKLGIPVHHQPVHRSARREAHGGQLGGHPDAEDRGSVPGIYQDTPGHTDGNAGSVCPGKNSAVMGQRPSPARVLETGTFSVCFSQSSDAKLEVRPAR